jgi:hypothetical protein
MWAIIGQVVGWVWEGLKAVGTGISIALGPVVRLISRGLGSVWNAARFSWAHILKPAGQWLDRMYQRAKALYENIYPKVHEWLGRITKALRLVYDAYFRPILDTIDHVRRVLHLLALLHVDFAAKLDRELALLEQKIALPILKAIEVINAIDSRIDAYVLTVDNLFKRVTLLGSVARDVGAIANIQFRSMLRNVPKRVDTGKPQHAVLKTPAEHEERLSKILDDEAGSEDVDVAAGVALFDEIMAA